MLDKYIGKLALTDPFFQKWWISLGDLKRRRVEEVLVGIDEHYTDDIAAVESQHEWCSHLLSRALQRIKQRDLLGYEIPKDWKQRVTVETERAKSLYAAQNSLREFLRTSPVEIIDFYGDIKKGESHKVIGAEKIYLWDVIRFRIVTRNLFEMMIFSRYMLHTFGTKCVRLRNLYAGPPKNKPDRGYRGIHTLLVLEDSEFVELQIRSEAREYVSWLDHILYKKDEQVRFSEDERFWLRNLSLKVNLAECEQFVSDAADRLFPAM